MLRRILRLHSDTARDYLVAYAREEVLVACVLALGHPRFIESQRCGKTCKRTDRDIIEKAPAVASSVSTAALAGVQG